MYKRILVGTDLSPTAKLATDRAASLARGLGAELVLVHAGPHPGTEFDELGARYEAETAAVQGNPAEVLIREAERRAADLLVVGSVGMTGPRRFMLGNVPNKVSHHAPTDLLIVKTDAPARSVRDYENVLVGTDGSDTATRAVDTAAQLCAALDAKPVIVCVFEPLPERDKAALRADPNDPIAQWDAPRSVLATPEEFRWRIAGASEAQDVLERAADRAGTHCEGAETRAVEGHPADVLVDLAEDEPFDLIVVGSVGMSGARRFMLGNVPHRVSHHAPVDVLILHTG